MSTIHYSQTTLSTPGGIWERLHYDRSDPHRVVLTTTDSNVCGGDSGYTPHHHAPADGKTGVNACEHGSSPDESSDAASRYMEEVHDVAAPCLWPAPRVLNQEG